MQVESFIPPLKLHRGYLSIKNYIKLKNKNEHSYTVKALNIHNNTNKQHPTNSYLKKNETWLQDIYKTPVKRRFIENLQVVPPWKTLNKYIIYNNEEVSNNEEFSEYLDNKFRNFYKIYTDGSKVQDETTNSVGCGIYDPQKKTITCMKIRSEHSVISSELYAIWSALNDLKEVVAVQNYVLFTDSRSALQLIASHNPKTYIDIVHKIQIFLLKYNANSQFYLHWIRSHVGITGNEIADRAANKAHQNNRTELYHLSESELISTLRTKFQLYWKSYWQQSTNITGKGIYLTDFADEIKFNTIIFNIKYRRSQVLINRFRMGHIGVRAYLSRFNMSEDEFCQQNTCDGNETVEDIEHFILYCPAYSNARDILQTKLRNININDLSLKTLLLGEKHHAGKQIEILSCFLEYLYSTNRVQTFF